MKNTLYVLIALIALGCGGLENEPIVLDDATVDANLEDAGITPDGGFIPDIGIVDAGTEADAAIEPDASTTPDAGKVDASDPDAGSLDAGGVDAGYDAGYDAGKPDAGRTKDAGYDAGIPDIGETWIDPATNRVWQKNHSEEKLDFDAAIDYCEKYPKWILPTIKGMDSTEIPLISTIDTCRKGTPIIYYNPTNIGFCKVPPCSCECYTGTGDKGSYFNPNLKVNLIPDESCGNEDSDNMVFWTGTYDYAGRVLVYDASNGSYKLVYPDIRNKTPKFYARCVNIKLAK
jgi:hypothetical protein